MAALVTDSTCDLGPEALALLGAVMVPVKVVMDDQRWLDWAEVQPATIYERMRAGATVSTEPPDTAQFVQVYSRLLAAKEDILSLHPSAVLSETVNRAREAASLLGAGQRITILEYPYLSAPLAEVVIAAARLLRSGLAVEEVVPRLQRLSSRITTQFTVESTEYLARRGLLSHQRSFLSGVLGVRPILTFKQGGIGVARLSRARQAGQDMVAYFEQRFGGQPVKVTLAFAAQEDTGAPELWALLGRSSLQVHERRVQQIGAAVGCYAGPGAYAVVALPVE